MIPFFVLLGSLFIWELLLRYYHQVTGKSLNNFAITQHTLLDTQAKTPDCYAKETWFEQYVTEARQVFYSAEWTPYSYWQTKAFTGAHINISAHLGRKTWQSSFTSDSNTKPLKIYMFGGSTLWGWGARDDFTIPSYLAKMLSRQYDRPVQILNYGRLGYVSSQEILTLLNLLREGHRPDMVIFYDGLNDVFSAYQSGVAGLPQNEMNRKLAYENSPLKNFLSYLCKQSYLYQHLQTPKDEIRALAQNYQKDAAAYQNLLEKTVHIYQENIKLIRAMAKEYGFSYHFFWQPVIFTKKQHSAFEQELLNTHQFWQTFCVDVYAHLHQTISEQAHENFSNLSTVFDNHSETLYVDPLHICEAGNQMVADVITKKIIKNLVRNNEKSCITV